MAVNVRLKHSSVDAKAPVAADLLEGEIALNINENSPAAYIKNSAGQIVKLAGEGSITDATNVKKAGDNMTGDLTLGTDKITLDAGTGAAEFAGGNIQLSNGGFYTSETTYGHVNLNVSSGGLLLSPDGTQLNATTILGHDGTGTFAGDVVSDGYFRTDRFSTKAGIGLNLGGTEYAFGAYVDSNNPVATIGLDGSAGFSGDVVIEENPGNNVEISSYGVIKLNSNNVGLSAAGALQVKFGGSIRAAINYDGSGTFDGDGHFKCGGADPEHGVQFINDGEVKIWRPTGGGPAANLITASAGVGTQSEVFRVDADGSVFSDGAATFVESIQSGGSPRNGVAAGSELGSFGGVNAARADGSFSVFNGWTVGTATPTSSILADGGAEFKGRVEIGNDIANASGTRIYSNGSVYVRHDTGQIGAAVWKSYNGGFTDADVTSVIYQDGTIQAGGNASNGNEIGARLNSYGAVHATRNTGTDVVWQGNVVGQDSTSLIHADGSAHFKGTVDSDAWFWSKNANSAYGGIYLYNFDGDHLRSNGAFYVSPNPSSSGNTIVLNYDGSARFDGAVTAAIVPPSDARFKENITPAKPQLTDVVALGGLLKNYDWNEDAPVNHELRAQRQLGLIAQEAAEVCPTIVKDIKRTKQGAVITPEETIPAVYEDKVIPAEYETIVTPAKIGPKGRVIVPESTEEVLVTPESTEQVLVTPEKVIPATYEELDDSYKGISTDALIMKLIGAVAELSAEVTALKAAKLT